MDLSKAVAVVGMSCSFPGGEGLDAFWETLRTGTCCMEEIRPDRWNISAFYDPDKDAPGKSYTKHAAFIDHWDMFDNQLFGISEKEAERMDPQQKVTLECVYRALENAGIPLEKISGTDAAVFMGQMNNDMGHLTKRDLSTFNGYNGTGTGRSILSNRISYLFNLHGPSVTIDTACSSGLVAIHHGAQSILSGESSAAICGGVSIMISPSTFVALSKARMSSEKGKCHAFSDQADGYARGEGCGVVVLKPIQKALQDGDRIWGYIAAGVNQDGRSASPITAPSGEMQRNLMTKLYANLNIKPENIEYIEAHGTGTKAGDPVEVNSIGAVIGAKRGIDNPCPIGSVKANIGHTESAAGLAGVIKILLMMKHNQIAPTVLHGNINPYLNLEENHLKVPTKVISWSDNVTRLAAVNSFGFGGTNAHAVIQSENISSHIQGESNGALLFAFSAKSKVGLIDSLQNVSRSLHESDYSLESLSYTSTVRRSHFNYRSAFVAYDKLSLVKQIDTALSKIESHEFSLKIPNVIFVFVGMGTHWSRMGLELYRCYPIFRSTIDKIEKMIIGHAKWSLLHALENEDLSGPLVGQPAIFAIQVAMASLLKSWGISPWGIIGHSVGEVAAAYIAGVLSLDTAVRIICARGQVLSKASGGSMLAVSGIPLETVCSMAEGKVDVAAINSPTSCTLSGDTDAIRDTHDQLSKVGEGDKKVFLKMLDVQVAFHSSKLDPFLPEFERSISDVSGKGKDTKVTLVSTVTGRLASESDFRSPKYWRQNARGTVLFSSAVETLSKLSDQPLVFVEIGPKPALARYIAEIVSLQRERSLIVSSMKENSEIDTLKLCLSALYRFQVDINWSEVWHFSFSKLCDFPKLSFQRKRLYFEAESITQWRQGLKQNLQPPAIDKHKLLTSENELSLRCKISKTSTPFVYEHRRSNKPVIPAAMYADIALGATCGQNPAGNTQYQYQLTIHFLRAFHIKDETTFEEINIEVDQHHTMPNDKRFFIKADGHLLSKGHCHKTKPCIPDILNIQDIKNRCNTSFSDEELYNKLSMSRFSYGSGMRLTSGGVKNDTELLAYIHMSEQATEESNGLALHPALLDSILQLTILLVPEGRNGMFAPVSLHQLVVLSSYWARAQVVHLKRISNANSQLEFEASLLSSNGIQLVHMKRLVVKPLDDTELQMAPLDIAYESVWRPETFIAQKWSSISAIHFSRNSKLGGFIEKNYPNTSCIQFSSNTLTSVREYGISELLKSKPVDNFTIIYSWGISDTDNSSSINDQLAKEQEHIIWTLIDLFKHLSTIEQEKRPSVIVFTRNVYKGCSSDETSRFGGSGTVHAYDSLLGASLWGVARTAVREGYPVYLIDGEHDLSQYVNLMKVALTCKNIYPEWLISGDKYFRHDFVPILDYFETDDVHLKDNFPHDSKLQQSSLNNSATENGVQNCQLFRSDSIYVVVGGTKGLGLETVKTMAANGAGKICVLSRKYPGKEASSVFDSLQSKYIMDISWIQTDVCNHESILSAFNNIKNNSNGMTIRGVFHGGVVLDDAMIPNMTFSKLLVPINPKMQGTIYLHQIAKDLPLDYFVMHSSVTATFGNPGQTGYAAANAFQDSFARYRRSLGLPGQSIIWGGLDLGLLQDNSARKRAIKSQGIGLLSKEEIERCFLHALRNRPVCIAYASMNWPVMISVPKPGSMLSHRFPFLKSGALKEINPIESAESRDEFKKSILKQKVFHAKQDVHEYMIQAISEQLVMQAETVNQLLDSPLVDIGLTSMDSISLQDIVKKELGIEITFIAETSISNLVSQIWGQYKAQKTTDKTLESTEL